MTTRARTTRASRPLLGLATATLAMLPACQGTDLGPRAASSVNAAEVAGIDSVPQILKPETIASYKNAMPRFGFAKLQRIIDDPKTFWYDHEAMPSSYQDSVAPDATVGCRRNNSGADLIDIIPGGREIFSPDAKTFNFPFAHTAGTDDSTNTHIANFMWLPEVGGKRLPIVYRIKNGSRSGIELRQWRWMYPKGTVFGEMIYVKDGSGGLHLAELRTRERYLGGWATNVYRPFPTAASLAGAIKSHRKDWESSETLKRFVDHLADNGTMTTKTRGSRVFPGVYEQEGLIDTLPDLGDAALVKELLTKTTFVSAYGAVWKENGSGKSFAASTKAAFSVVPNNYDAGLIEVKDASCQRCHKDAQRPINEFAEQAVLYGDIWGADQIFSFHPFDPALCRGAAEDNRALRPVFKSSGLVQSYDASAHGAQYYQELQGY